MFLGDPAVFDLYFIVIDVDDLLLMTLLLLLDDFRRAIHVENNAQPSQRSEQQNLDQKSPVSTQAEHDSGSGEQMSGNLGSTALSLLGVRRNQGSGKRTMITDVWYQRNQSCSCCVKKKTYKEKQKCLFIVYLIEKRVKQTKNGTENGAKWRPRLD